LRMADSYQRLAEGLLERHSLTQLQDGGLFNKDGHLRFYRHSLLIPWFDGAVPVYVEAFAPEAAAVPPVLTVTGVPPCPYNAGLLDGTPGRLYLCSRTLETLELLEAGFPAVGLPVSSTLRNGPSATSGMNPAWLPRFRNKSVYLAFDGDATGEADAARVMAFFANARSDLHIEVHRLEVPVGKRVGDWVAGR